MNMKKAICPPLEARATSHRVLWVHATNFPCEREKLTPSAFLFASITLHDVSYGHCWSSKDFSSTGEVSNTRFRSLVNLAPSFERFVAWGAALCAQPWFVGFLNKNEATMLLQQEPQGTFLVRMHKTVRGALVISYVSHARGILHHIVQRDKIGFSMLNCEGAWPTLEELIEHSHFLASPYASKHLPVELIRSHYFLGEAGRENAEALFEGLAPGVFAVRLQPLAFVPPSTLLSNSSLYKNTPNSTSSPPAPSNDLNESSNSTQSPHNSNSTRSPASAHPQSSPASTTHSNSPSLVPIECPTSPAITSSPVSGFKDVCIILSTMAGNGLVRHTYVLRDFEERIFVAGKPYETLATYLEAHKSNFVVPFSPSISRFKTQLDTSHLMPVMNPSPVASRPLSSRRNSSRLGASNSSLSSSAGAHLTRSKNESDTTDDSEDSPYHNINYKNCGGNRPSPNVSHDDLIIPVRCESPSYSDDLPVFEMTGISLMPGSALGGIFGKTAARRSIVSGERTSGSSTLSHSSILGPDTTPLSLSETTASGLGAFSQFETGSRHSSSLLHGNDLAASSAVVPNHVSMVGTSCTGGSFGSGLGTGSHLPSTPSRASIAASSAAIIAPSSYSRRDGVYYTNAALDAAEIPRTKPAWKPLTDQQVNPHLLTYRDMWAELLRYYHVPVPEAKLKPKQNSLHSSSGASHATKSSSSSSSHQKSSKRR